MKAALDTMTDTMTGLAVLTIAATAYAAALWTVLTIAAGLLSLVRFL